MNFTLSIAVDGIDEIKRLPQPNSHLDLKGAVLNVKAMEGLDTWKPLPLIHKVANIDSDYSKIELTITVNIYLNKVFPKAYFSC